MKWIKRFSSGRNCRKMAIAESLILILVQWSSHFSSSDSTGKPLELRHPLVVLLYWFSWTIFTRHYSTKFYWLFLNIFMFGLHDRLIFLLQLATHHSWFLYHFLVLLIQCNLFVVIGLLVIGRSNGRPSRIRQISLHSSESSWKTIVNGLIWDVI